VKPLRKNIKRYFSFTELAIVLTAIIVSICVGVAVFLNFKREVVINEDGKQIELKTMKTTVKEVLEQNGISVTTDDYISVPLNTKLQRFNKTVINIKKAVPINILIEGKIKKLYTYRDTVKDALAYSPIDYSGKDRLDGASLSDKVVSNMSFRVIKVKEEIEKEKLNVPFKVITRENNHLDKGKTLTVRSGKDGEREKQYKVVYEDGKQDKKDLISDKIVAAPISKIIDLGTVMNFRTSRGDVVRYSKVIDMSATSYTASYADTGKHPGDPGFGITATGMRAREGIVAVDPNVIALGTRLYIEGVGSTPNYGFALAGDTGGAIKGNKIDLFYKSQSKSNWWGRRNVRVYILVN